MLRSRRRWVPALLALLLTAGCWDRREIEERSTILATSLDLCGEEENCRVLVTRQVAVPGGIPAGGAGGGAQHQGESNRAVTVIRTPARDIMDSEKRVQAQLNYRADYGHVRLIVISEDLARSGELNELYLDFARRTPEAPRLRWIAVSEADAGAVLQASPRLEPVPALFLNDMIEDAARRGALPRISLGDFLVAISNRGEDPVTPLFRMAGADRPSLAGLAVFRGTVMVGKLDPEETVTYMQLRGLRRATELLRVPLAGGREVSLSVYGRSVRYGIRAAGGRVYATIRLRLESSLFQAAPGVNASDPVTLDRLERQAEREVVNQARALLKRLQEEFQADVLGIGERVRAQLPAFWQQTPDWTEAFRRARIDVEVEVHIRRSGLMAD